MRLIETRGETITKPIDYLAEWMLRFLKNKDLLLRRTTDITHQTEEGMIIASMKDGTKHAYLLIPFMENSDVSTALKTLSPYEACSLVLYNTRKNFDVMLSNWKKLAGFRRNFSLNFINPFSRTEKRWVVYPSTHELVTDKPKLRQSLKVLFSKVEPLTEDELEKILKEQ